MNRVSVTVAGATGEGKMGRAEGEVVEEGGIGSGSGTVSVSGSQGGATAGTAGARERNYV